MEGSKLYVGNLSYSVTSEQLKELFGGFGEVGDIRIIEGKGGVSLRNTDNINGNTSSTPIPGEIFVFIFK